MMWSHHQLIYALHGVPAYEMRGKQVAYEMRKKCCLWNVWMQVSYEIRSNMLLMKWGKQVAYEMKGKQLFMKWEGMGCIWTKRERRLLMEWEENSLLMKWMGSSCLWYEREWVAKSGAVSFENCGKILLINAVNLMFSVIQLLSSGSILR